MRISELVEACKAAIEREHGTKDIILVSYGRAPLPRKGFPRGELLSDSDSGKRVYAYSAVKVLAALVAAGLYSVNGVPIE